MDGPFRAPSTSRRRALLLAPLLVVLAGLGGSHVLLNQASVGERVRARIVEKLWGRLGPCALGQTYVVSWRGVITVGPFVLQDAGGEPLIEVERIQIRPSYLRLLRGHLEPATVTLDGVRLHSDARGERLLRLRRRLQGRPGAAAGSSGAQASALPSKIFLTDVRVELEPAQAEGKPAVLGPFNARVLRTDVGLHAELQVEPKGSLELDLERGQGKPLSVRVAIHALPLERLLPSVGGVELLQGIAEGTISLQQPEPHGLATLAVNASIRELTAQGERLDPEPMGPMRVGLRGTFKLEPKQRQFSVDDGRLLLGTDGLEVPFEAGAGLLPEPHFNLDVRFGPANLSQLIAALPPQLRPGEAAPVTDGPLRAEIRAQGPLRRPEAWSVDVKLDTVALKQSARALPFPLREPFPYTPQDQAGSSRTFTVGPRNPGFVPIDALPAILPLVVTTSEDASFFAHNGFDFDELRDSFASVSNGTRFRGGSTLSQQLVKNLYLSRERTLSRKVREALITLEMEAALPKARILEIYLNIIEWGPGVYGVGEAAQYYFGVDARTLSLKQCVFLATVIPAPLKWGPYFKHHGPSDHWNARMADLLEKLRQREAITAEERDRAVAEPLHFRT
jgi:penicillin-binding protein 1A